MKLFLISSFVFGPLFVRGFGGPRIGAQVEGPQAFLQSGARDVTGRLGKHVSEVKPDLAGWETTEHDKKAGGGYRKNSPLFNAQKTATPDFSRTAKTGTVKRTYQEASFIEIGVAVVEFVVVFAVLVFAMPKVRGHASLDKFGCYIAEFVGTYVLVFTVGCCIAGGSGTWNALAIASVLMVMIFATAGSSGANLNPAVSLTLMLTKNLAPHKMAGYWVAQILGGIIAGFSYRGLFPDTVLLNVGAVAPGPGFEHWHVAIVELLYTFMLCFVVLNTATVNTPNNYFGLAIGFVIVAGGYAVGGISGAAFNPAVAIGLGISKGGSTSLLNMLFWAICELAGAALAAGVFKAMFERGSRASKSLGAKLLSEFLGTFMLVLTVGLNLATGSPATALSAAMALMCMIYALGDVSGAHFNPAVSLAVLLRNDKDVGSDGREISKFKVVDFGMYVATQVFAGICAGVLYAVFHSYGPQKDVSIALGDGGEQGPLAGASVEYFATFVLAYVVLCVATVGESNHYFGLAIGSCVVAGGFAIGGLSGGELNPAVTIGIYIANLIHHGAVVIPAGMNCILYVLFELIGGMVAAGVFHLTHAKELVSKAPQGMKDAGFQGAQ